MSLDAVNEIFSHFCHVILKITTEIKKKKITQSFHRFSGARCPIPAG